MIVKEALLSAKRKLDIKKIKTSLLDTEVLLSYVLKKTREWIYANNDKKIIDKNLKRYLNLIDRREKYIPVAYLTNNREFYGLDFYVNKNVLIPRPETEQLVEIALKEIKNNKKKIAIADIGTGSGCIAISLAKNIKSHFAKASRDKQFKIYATDISENSLSVAKKNAKKHKVFKNIKFLKGNLLEPLKEKPDIIISNPPYVLKNEKVSPEVKFEPKKAVFIPNKFFFGELISQINNKLKTGGFAFIEIGYNKKESAKNTVKKIMPDSKISFIKDYSGIVRFLKIKKIPA